jgi:ATP/maltotriose-dependent transcriptional regulator MalT
MASTSYQTIETPTASSFSNLISRSAYMLGKIAACQNDLDEAHAQLERAFKLLSSGKPTHASVASAKFQQGCVYLRQGKDIEALRLFRDALAICQMNEAGKGTKADSARVKWRLSQAMSRQGMDVEAEAFRAAAEETKKTLFATGLYPQGEGEDREYDSLVGLLYR